MNSFRLFAIALGIFLCEAKPTNEHQKLPKETYKGLSRITGSASSKMGPPETGSASDLPDDIRTNMGYALGLPLAYASGSVVGPLQGLIALLRSMDLSNGDMFHVAACGLYQGFTRGEEGVDKTNVDVLNAVMNAVGVDTPPDNFPYNRNELEKCPYDSKGQFEALLSATKRTTESCLHGVAFPVAIPFGLAEGGKQGVAGIWTGLTQSSDKCDSSSRALGIVDSGMKGFGRGVGDGFMNAVTSIHSIQLD